MNFVEDAQSSGDRLTDGNQYMPKPKTLKFKITHLTTELSGGSGIACQRLHKALLKKNISSQLVFRQGATSLIHSNSDRRHNSIIWRNLESITISQQWKQSNADCSLFTSPQWIYKTRFQDIAPEASIINLHWISRWIDQPSFFNSLPKNIPVVWSLHDMNPLTGGCHHARECDRFTRHCANCPNLKKPGNRDQAWKNFKLKAQLYPQLNLHFVGNSTWTTAQAEKSFLGQYARSIRTIPLGIETQDYQSIDRPLAKQAFRIAPERFVIAFACADLSDKNKNLSVLLTALTQLAEQQPLTLITFGAGELPPLDEALQVIPLGRLSSPYLQSLAYSAADVFAMPSAIESFGLTALEAMACGTPVIAFRTGGLTDLVLQGETGWLADAVSSPAALYQGLSWLLQHPQERMAMGQNARQRVEREFNADLMGDRYISLYEELLSL